MKITTDVTNDRVKGFECQDPVLSLKELENILINAKQFTKAIAYLTPPQWEKVDGPNCPWQHEATISGFYSGQDALLVTLYTRRRSFQEDSALIADVIRASGNKTPSDLPALQHPFLLRSARNEDCTFLASLFKQVFPFYADHEVYDPLKLQQRIQTKSHIYHVIEDTTTNKLAAVACADLTEPQYQSCELGDCVVLPQYQGKALMQYLFLSLEEAARLEGFKYLFTMTRATSYPMNLCAKACGYKMTGTMINNCHMTDGRMFESMNIWCKDPQQSKL